MQPSLTLFYQDLWSEHIEEASALYEQRTALIADPELSWLDLEEYERRIEAHLDALVLGGEPALTLAAELAAGADAGTLYAVVCLFCRQDRFPLLAALLPDLDWDDTEICQVIRDALVAEAPQAWLPALATLAAKGEVAQNALTLAVLSRRGSPLPQALVSRLRSQKAFVASLIRCFAKQDLLREKPWLQELLISETDPEILTAASFALLVAGDETVSKTLASLAAVEAWTRIPLALAATPTQAALLLEGCRRQPEPAGIQALGLLGEMTAVPLLLTLVAEETLAPAAACSLEWLTGAGLYEEVFVPETADEDELFEDEIEAVAQGQPVMNPNLQPAGEQVRRLAQDAEMWHQWWREHQRDFAPGLRYRSGHPLSPETLLQNLNSADSGHELRMWAATEFAVRYGCDIPFFAEMRIAEQQKTIAAFAAWVEKNSNRFEPGKAYFQARPQ